MWKPHYEGHAILFELLKDFIGYLLIFMFSIAATLFICYVFLFLYSIKIKDNSIADVFW